MLYWLQQTGHRPIALMGGGTTRVGDPSGKDESRRILTDEMIDGNLTGIRAIFSKFLKFEGAGGNAIMANNADWLNKLNYIDFLRDVGRHFSVNRMLSFDSVKLRLERQQELSFLEFNYMPKMFCWPHAMRNPQRSLKNPSDSAFRLPVS